MLSARYGRMKIGRCVRQEPALVSIMQDPRYLGCSSNVVDFVSRQCSGRSQCTLRVNDQNFNIVSPCYDSLKMYLEATYVCLDGTSLFSQVEKQRSKTKFGENRPTCARTCTAAAIGKPNFVYSLTMIVIITIIVIIIIIIVIVVICNLFSCSEYVCVYSIFATNLGE